MKRVGLILLVIALCCATVAIAGTARPGKTRVTLRIVDNLHMHGRLIDKRAACTTKRFVSVWRVLDGPDELRAFASSTGPTYEFNDPKTPYSSGKYYATVKKRTLPNGKVCKFDRTRNQLVL